MYKATIIGHFSFKKETLNGQTIKTKIVAETLKKQFDNDAIRCEDTHGGWHFLLRSPFILLRSLSKSRNIIILPAYKGVRIIVPLLVIMNTIFHRKLHYVVIGGWLPTFIEKKPLLKFLMKHIDNIYVETRSMQKELTERGMKNIIIMPNFKQLNVISKDRLRRQTTEPYRLCTFSRVSVTKGIEDAIRAVTGCNERLKRNAFSLDIYGQVEDQEWFDNLMRRQPQGVRYCGKVAFDRSTEILSEYFALLFPTFYSGEGFAGTLIDAMSAGLPTIATNWKANSEIIDDGKTGILYTTRDVKSLMDILECIAENPDKINAMRESCLNKANEYQPETVIRILTDKMQ